MFIDFHALEMAGLFRRSPHAPPHLDLSALPCFISASTVNRVPHLRSTWAREMLRDTIRKTCRDVNADLYAWCVMPEHYHLVLRFQQEHSLSRFLRLLHARSSLSLNRRQSRIGRQVWYNFWDYTVRNEMDFFRKICYVHWNPVHHGLVAAPGDYPFSSYSDYAQLKGSEWLTALDRRFPVRELEDFDKEMVGRHRAALPRRTPTVPLEPAAQAALPRRTPIAPSECVAEATSLEGVAEATHEQRPHKP